MAGIVNLFSAGDKAVGQSPKPQILFVKQHTYSKAPLKGKGFNAGCQCPRSGSKFGGGGLGPKKFGPKTWCHKYCPIVFLQRSSPQIHSPPICPNMIFQGLFRNASQNVFPNACPKTVPQKKKGSHSSFTIRIFGAAFLGTFLGKRYLIFGAGCGRLHFWARGALQRLRLLHRGPDQSRALAVLSSCDRERRLLEICRRNIPRAVIPGLAGSGSTSIGLATALVARGWCVQPRVDVRPNLLAVACDSR